MPVVPGTGQDLRVGPAELSGLARRCIGVPTCQEMEKGGLASRGKSYKPGAQHDGPLIVPYTLQILDFLVDKDPAACLGSPWTPVD